MSRNFSMVSPRLWHSPRFRRLTDEAKLLLFYLLTSDHQTSAGCFRLLNGYVCADLDWDEEKYLRCRDELVKGDLVAVDPESSFIYVQRWFKHSPPTNVKHRKAVASQIEKIESVLLRELVAADLGEIQGSSDQEVSRDTTKLMDTPYMKGKT